MCNNYLDVSNSSDPSTIDLSKIYKLAQAKNVHYSDYNSYELAKTTVSNMTVGRQWTYQYCTMFGWFQTPSNETEPARSYSLLERNWEDYCQRIYGEDVTKPSPSYVNNTLGSREMSNGTNTFMFNALEDPW